MAKKQAGEAKKGSTFKKILIFGIVGLVVIGGAVGAGLYILGPFSKQSDAAEIEPGAAGAASDPLASPQYLTLDPPFIVNFGDEAALRYLQVGVAVMTRDGAIIEQVTNNLPHIRNNLIMLFGSQKESTLNSTQGKEKLRLQTLEEIQSILQKEIGKPGVEDVFFTSFVMQ